jgi:hypothetical protein
MVPRMILHDYMIKVMYRFLGNHPLAHMIHSMYQDNTCDVVNRGKGGGDVQEAQGRGNRSRAGRDHRGSLQ